MHCENYKVRIDIAIEVDGKKIIDSKIAKLLLLIDRYGSILAASRVLEMPYSRAWEALMKAERALKKPLVETKRGGRGGGGARLTSVGRRLLKEYTKVYRKIVGKDLEVQDISFIIPSLVYMGSHDPNIEVLAGLLREKGITSMELSWLGSGIGLAALALGEADVVGIHLLDPESGEYNKPYIKRYWLENDVILIRGYCREIGFITRNPTTYDEVIRDLIENKSKLVNRQKGSGTRVLLEHVLDVELRKMGLDSEKLVGTILGPAKEVRTHTEVAKAIVSREADVGMGIKWAAVQYGLHFIHVKWENFDFAIPKHKYGKEEVEKFLEVLRSGEFREKLSKLPGYRIPRNLGERIL